MPFAHIRIARDDSITQTQKELLITRVTEAIADVLHKDAKATHVVIEDVDPHVWGVGGKTIASLRQQT